MEYKRDKAFGAIDLNYLEENNDLIWIEKFDIENKAQLMIDDKLYYLKKRKLSSNLYNEMVAEEIARDFQINVASTDIFIYNDIYGIMSESIVQKNEIFIPATRILGHDYLNNLEDIWAALEHNFEDRLLVAKLMDEIVNIFLFDVLVGNVDRHEHNYGFIKRNNSISVAPLYDNEDILSRDSIKGGYYCLGIGTEDFIMEMNNNLLYKFLSYSDNMYLERLKSKLWIIESENIERVIERVGKRVGKNIDGFSKILLLKRFSSNLKMIKSVILKIDNKKIRNR